MAEAPSRTASAACSGDCTAPAGAACLQFASLRQAKNTQPLLHNSKQRAEGKTRHPAGQNKTAAALQQLSTLPSFTHPCKQSWTKPTTGPSSSLQVCKRSNAHKHFLQPVHCARRAELCLLLIQAPDNPTTDFLSIFIEIY